MPETFEEIQARARAGVPVPQFDEETRARSTLAPEAPAPGRIARRERVHNIGDTERIASVAGGTLLVLLGLSRRSWVGAALAGAGGFLAYRGATGHSYVYERLGVSRPDGPLGIVQSVTVNRRPQEVYRFWRDLQNLPRFMRHLRSVERLSDTRSHWVAQAMATSQTIEWDAEIVDDKPNEFIGWRSLPNGGLQHSGEVRFRAAPGGRGTEVHVHMEYRPPVGTAIGALMYPFSRQMLKEEIRRLKHVLEAGEIPTTEGQPSGATRR